VSIPWPFGGRTTSALNEPAPEIIMAANGVYWRRYQGKHEIRGSGGPMLSIVPVSTDNDVVMTPYAIYALVGWEDHDGTFHPVEKPRPMEAGDA
jgi:hypothetical protein